MVTSQLPADGATGEPLLKSSQSVNPCSFQVPKEYQNHYGGQPLLDVARQSKCPDILFLSYHMGSDLNGKVCSAAKALGVEMPKSSVMYNEMHEAFRKVRKEHPEEHTYMIAYCLALTVLLPTFFFWWLFQPSLLLGIVTASLFELFFFNIFHTRHHRSGELYESKFFNKLVTPMYDFIEGTWGYAPAAWRTNHNVKHHVYTNDTGTDTDVPSMYPYVRSCNDTEKLWFHRFQTFYWPLLMPFAGVNFPVNNVLVHNAGFFNFGAWIGLMFILPGCLHGWHAVAQSMFLQAWAGASLAYKFAVSHAHDDLLSTVKEDATSDIDSWLKGQIGESINYGGYWFTFIFGGINLQIEHHLCPSMDPALYFYVAPEIERICKKHGVTYTREPSFFVAVYQFHKKLWTMGWE